MNSGQFCWLFGSTILVQFSGAQFAKKSQNSCLWTMCCLPSLSSVHEVDGVGHLSSTKTNINLPKMIFAAYWLSRQIASAQAREGEVGLNLADGVWHTVNVILINEITFIITIIMMIINRCEWGLPRKILPFVSLLMLLQV